MAVEFKSSMSKNELLEIAAEHGIEADDSMKKNDILKLLEQARAAEGAQEPQDGAETPPEGNDPAEGDEATQEPQDGEESTTGDSDTEPPAEDAQEAAPEGYGLFVYAGPSLPHGRLKEHAVFNGTFEDVKAYLADVLEDYPQAERLIVPVERLSAFAAKVKAPGNIAHKYYNDIVSTMRGNKVTSYTAGTDYELFYEGENLILEVLDGGSIPAETGELTITFDAVDPSKINENDIIGGFDTSTKKYSGLELIDKVFPKYGIVPDLIVAPGWSDKSNVAAVMTAKADAINTVFTGAKALIDADTNTVRHYADVPAWKKAQNMNSKAEILCWPMFGLGDRAFHASVHAAGLMGKTDSDNGGCPAESPSNKSLQIDRAMLADGTTVLLDLAQANYLNSNGIVTALNFIGSYVLWGDETACFPADTDVKNYFISVSRMFGWVARSVILTYWSKIDKKMTRRLIDSIVDSVNIWLNGLVSEEKLLGARVEFLDEENSTTALMAGKAVFHIYMTPASPMRECEFVLEYDADYVTAALSA